MPSPGVQVLNDQPLEFPKEVKVAVLNKNPDKAVLRFDGVEFEFEPGEATIVDTQTAFALFAVDTRTPPNVMVKCHRSKTAGPGGNANSFYNECLIKYGATAPNGRQWFENFDFKLVKSVKKLTSMDFDKIPIK